MKLSYPLTLSVSDENGIYVYVASISATGVVTVETTSPVWLTEVEDADGDITQTIDGIN